MFNLYSRWLDQSARDDTALGQSDRTTALQRNRLVVVTFKFSIDWIRLIVHYSLWKKILVWLDTRTHGIVDEMLLKCNNNPNHFKEECGLPISTYFSALKIKWLMENVLQVKTAISQNECAFGTVDSWLLWNLLGNKSVHATDVTNASRTMLMNLKTLQWDNNLCK